MALGYAEGCPTVCSRSSRLFVERIESFQHRVESITFGTHDAHPNAQSGETGLGEAIHRPGRSRGCRFFPRVEKSVALEVSQGPVDARSVDGSELFYSVPGVRVADPKACQCGEVLKGVIKPWECKVFGTACTPETPIGTCMVSSEGACAAYYNFGRLHREAAVTLGRASR